MVQTSEPRKLPDRKGYYIKIKWPIHQKDIAILNGKCTPNNNAEKYVKKKTDTNQRKKKIIPKLQFETFLSQKLIKYPECFLIT